jgi:UrcA family protein
MSRTLVAAAAAFATLATFATGTAATAREIAVSYADLNLDTAAGRDRLEARIHRAARSACGDYESRRPLSEREAVSRCVRSARESARTQMAARMSDIQIGG